MKNRFLVSSAAVMVAFAATLLGTAGCDNDAGPVPEPTAAAAPADALPGDLALSAAPAGAVDAAAARAGAKDGDRVVVRGVVGGRADPIAENRAILTLLDPAIKTCDKTEGDACKTPWDACCEPADVRARSSVTVQVVDADGRPLRASLASLPGVKPLARLLVTGTAKVGADGAVVVNADGLFVEP